MTNDTEDIFVNGFIRAEREKEKRLKYKRNLKPSNPTYSADDEMFFHAENDMAPE